MNWLELLSRCLDDGDGGHDVPCLVVDATLPTDVWWSDNSLPFVHVTPRAFGSAHAQLQDAFGVCAIMFEGDA